MDIGSEQLAYWYLRLNGFLTITNFVVHPDTGRDQRTDVDVLGVRFPYRAENLISPMEDEDRFTGIRKKNFVVIAEVKRGRCSLNGPWTNPDEQNMLRVLCAIGIFPKNEALLAAQSIYKEGCYQSRHYYVSLMCFGSETNPELKDQYPQVSQILWPDVLDFIYRRFREYRYQKASHPQWDKEGNNLWQIFERSSDEHSFKEMITVL